MPTAEPPRATARPENDPLVYNPLDRLRGVIRRYVLLEGLLSALLFVAVWFSLGLVLDYGAFKVAGWDWVQDGAKWLRVVALGAALAVFAAILVFRIARRVTTEFSYPALALVLERKFPTLLGDRLITAVEMADVETMGKYGYSRDMIRATIAEARERVGKVPVREAFNWKRLWVLGFLAVGLMLGTVAVAFASYAVATGSADVYRFGWKFAHVSGIFAERNVALLDTPWPRRAHLELVGFAGDELAVGRDAPAPRVACRAYRWVVADRTAPDGWRPLLWADVTEDLVGRPVPPVPDAVTAATAAAADRVTVDQLARALDEAEPATAEVENVRTDARGAMGGGYADLQAVFAALAAKAEEPAMGRTLRRLDLPEQVTYRYAGRRTAGSGELGTQPNNEFAGEITGLKEDVEFVIRAADFVSPAKKIRLIPPPTLRRLYRDQAEPAYLHHEPPAGAGYDALKGKFQTVATKDLSLTGDRTVFAVPAGAELTLVAEAYAGDDGVVDANDRIVSAAAVPVSGRFPGTAYDDKGKPTQAPVPVEVTGDGSGFRIPFPAGPRDADPVKNKDFRLMDAVEFRVTWLNKYNVSATRSFLIQVVQDQAPTVEVAADVIRRQGNVYLVTPAARIPFHPDSFVKDDHGLSKVEYTFTYYAEDSDVVRGLRAGNALRSIFGVPVPGSGPARAILAGHADNFRRIDKADERMTGSVLVSDFDNQRRKIVSKSATELERALKVPRDVEKPPEAVRKVDLRDPTRDYFDLKELHESAPGAEPVLKIAAPRGEIQTIYRMDLNVVATDNNVDSDTGKAVTRNAEPIRLRIVSEADLLYEISKEEEQLAARLDEAIAKLMAAKEKYRFVSSANGYKAETPDNVDPIKVRSNDALGDVEKARDVVQSVGREFQRIARECEVNRVAAVTQANYNRIVKYYGTILADRSDDGQIPRTFPQAQDRLAFVQNQLGAGRWAPGAAVTDAASDIALLEAGVRFIRALTGESIAIDRLRQNLLKLKTDQERIGSQILKLKVDAEKIFTTPFPLIRTAGVLSFVKGESKRLAHTISWNQYDGDTIKVKVAASDPSITVPAELTLDFEKNTTRFDYEVKAGNKEGTFKITLTPAVGPPVEVQLVVK